MSNTPQEKLLVTIQNNIGDSLPEFVGIELQKVLKQATEDAETVVQLRKELVAKNNSISELSAEISKLKANKVTSEELDEKRRLIKEERNNLDIDKLTYQLQAEKDKTKFSQDVALGLVRNTNYRRSVIGSDAELFTPPNSSYPQVMNKPFSEQETITEE